MRDGEFEREYVCVCERERVCVWWDRFVIIKLSLCGRLCQLPRAAK